MEAPNQDAMLKQTSPDYQPDTGGPVQVPDSGQMLNQEYDPTALSGDANTLPTTPTDEEETRSGNDGTSALSDGAPSPADDETIVAHDYGPTETNQAETTSDEQRNRLAHQSYVNAQSGHSTMEADEGPTGNDDAIGNNDGTQPSPEAVGSAAASPKG